MAAMKALSRLESVLQQVMERPQRLFGPKHVHPLTIAASLTRSLEAQVLPVGDRVVAPNRFTVRLHPDDDAQLADVRGTLERELGLFVGRAAVERGLSLSGKPAVVIRADQRVTPGAVQVDATFDTDRVAAAPPLTAPGGFTERIAPVVGAPARPATTLRPLLELLTDSGQVEGQFPLSGELSTIGRRSGNDVPVDDIEVSRQHARIDYVAPRYYLSDLGSTNGTHLNGRLVAGRQMLKDGDLIDVGNRRLRFRQSTGP